MIKNYKKLLSLALVTMLAAFSVISVQGVTLYEDGDYVFADTGDGSVSLYKWQGTGELLIPNAFQNKYVTSVYNYAFMDNKQITSLDFSNNYILNSIGTKAFCGCSSVSGEVILPSTVQTLSLGAFQECTNLQTLTLNGSVTVIPEQCCYQDYRLTEVNLPTNLESIEKLAFADCYSLGQVYIPASVTEIHETAFDNCGNLVIACRFGTYAYQYAKDNNIPYVLLDGVKLGDANGDNRVNINDVTKVQRALAELEELTGIRYHAADINNDGTLAIDDASLVQAYLAEYEVVYAVGEVMTQ